MPSKKINFGFSHERVVLPAIQTIRHEQAENWNRVVVEKIEWRNFSEVPEKTCKARGHRKDPKAALLVNNKGRGNQEDQGPVEVC